jgi:hypothetical protein
VDISEHIHPNNPEDFGGSWKACYNDSALYVLVVVNDEANLQGRRVAIELKGTDYSKFEAYRSIDGTEELYHPLGTFDAQDGKIIYEVPSKSVTTFFA